MSKYGYRKSSFSNSQCQKLHRRLFYEFGIDNKQLNDFNEILINTDVPTIDEFLLINKDFTGFDLIGKLAIIQVILEFENYSKIINNKRDHWLQLFSKKIFPNNQYIPGINNYTILTFNYDRIIEEYFYNTIKVKLNGNIQRVNEIINTFRIIHVNGYFGNPFNSGQGNNFLPFGPFNSDRQIQNIGLIRKILNTFHLQHESNTTNPNYTDMVGSILAARNIYFLGFGYDAFNLGKLPFTEQSFRTEIETKRIMGTGMGIGITEKENIKNIILLHRSVQKEISDSEFNKLFPNTNCYNFINDYIL